MDLNDIAKRVHDNAVAHGWWPEGRTDAEVLALIHSEWSEALEAYRDEEPMVWHQCDMDSSRCAPNGCYNWDEDSGKCNAGARGKPEGVAVELIDGCIRVLDACAAWGLDPLVDISCLYFRPDYVELCDLPRLIAYLHYETSSVFSQDIHGGHHAHDCKAHCTAHFNCILSTVWIWLEKQGVDPEAVLEEKHRYNITRPYKHGGKLI